MQATDINYCTVIQNLSAARDRVQDSVNALPLFDERRKTLYALQDAITAEIKRWQEEESRPTPSDPNAPEWDLSDFGDK